MSAAPETVHVRLLPHPREKVFAAWTDPATLARWWGPKGFRNTNHRCEPAAGGAWEYTMHAPDGTDYLNKSVFVEVSRPERIVIDHLEPMHRFWVTATFAEKSGGTEVTFRQTFESAEEFARIVTFVKPANEQNLDRLEAVLRGESPT
ncbi:MAG: SRPBCC family protein [Elusimicrobiota bacterium]|nr:MAG: SRPBCC family protein [Elusimicrobiota bacterium]